MLKPLAAAIAVWSPERSGAAEPLDDVAAAWSEVVGAQSARNSRPLRIAGDALIVATRSSAWSEQLSFLADRILASLRDDFGLKAVQRLRFRVGRLAPRHRVVHGTIAGAARPVFTAAPGESSDVDSAFVRLRNDVGSLRRAKSSAGWKECSRCANLIPPGERAICTACTIAISQERERLVARLLFEAPWLGYDGIAPLVDGLDVNVYDDIRSRVLARWWAMLARAARTKRVSRDRRERLVASSYVIVKSEVEPERIAPATMRTVLGDEIFELLFDPGE